MVRHGAAAGHAALLEAARAEFAERGYAAASIRSLAERAGVSMSVLYHYYSSKQELLEAIISEQAEDYQALCAAELRSVSDDPTERLGAAVRATIRFRVSNPARAAMPHNELRSASPQFLAAYVVRLAEATAVFREPIEAGVASGIFCPADPGSARRAIIAMCNAVGDWYDSDGPTSLDEVITAHIDLALLLVGYDRTAGVEPHVNQQLQP